MLPDIDLLLERLFSAYTPEDIEKRTGIKATTIATIRSRLKKGSKSISAANLCKLAHAHGEDPLLVLLSYVHDQITGGKEKLDSDDLTTLIGNGLCNLAEVHENEMKRTAANSTSPLSLADFPYRFQEPFVVVTGDRREMGGRKITPADFGALSASPADIRWLFQLRLPKDTEVITDKLFALASFEELQKRLSCVTLICVGSPASNHLARVLNRYSLFRFNLPAYVYEQCESLIRDAWEKGGGASAGKIVTESRDQTEKDFFCAERIVPGFDYEALGQFRDEREIEIRHMKYAVFSGGFIDPTYPYLIRGLDKSDDRDFGVISLAQNPFRTKNDGQYPALYFSGYHLPGTCRSLASSIWSDRSSFFADHPFGGIIRADLRPAPERGFYPFYERMENFDVKWDDESSYSVDDLLSGLSKLSDNPTKSCHMLQHEARRAHHFLSQLIPHS